MASISMQTETERMDDESQDKKEGETKEIGIQVNMDESNDTEEIIKILKEKRIFKEYEHLLAKQWSKEV